MCRLVLVAIVLSSVTLLSACSQPPDKERGQAEGAIAAARAASAEVYAADELLAAEAALSRYDDAVAQKDYRQALNAALDARDRGYEAVKRASTAKADARGQAERLVTALDALATSINDRIASTATPRLSAAAAQRLRQAVAVSASTMQEARTAIDDGQYPVAIIRLEAALADLQKEFDAVPRRDRQ
jgi:predicted  nucleic acid-binding Zn-ribbon protein